jgi:hypothetical protein
MNETEFSKGEEIKRINNYNNGEFHSGASIYITVTNLEDPEAVLQKTKEVMLAISQYAYTNEWPAEEEWTSILPNWFVISMTSKTDEELDDDLDQWHYESWVSNIKDRAWVWWSSKKGENWLKFQLVALNIPYLHDSFKYIFYAQGVPMESISDKDDIYDIYD